MGREDAEVLAGAFRRPRGSFRAPVRRRTEPRKSVSCDQSPIETFLPGTSWVSGSFNTPMLHFVGFPLSI